MRLLGRTGTLAGHTVTVTGPTQIGRAPENDLAVTAEGVSRHHARIVPEGEAFWLEDLNSSNGTFLNGRRITREQITHLDVITLGQSADLIVDARRSDSAMAKAQTAAAEIALESVDGPDGGTRLAVTPGELTFGRVAPSNVVLDSRIVSKIHARLRRTGDAIVIQDLQSSNGTFVNGHRISEATALKDGDTISIAGVRTFRVRITGAKPDKVSVAAVPERVDQVFDQEWKTRLVWSPEEVAVLEAERARIVAEVRRTVGALPGEAPDERRSGPPPSPPPLATPAGRPAPAPATEFVRLEDNPLVPPVMPIAAAGPPAIRALRLRGGTYEFVLQPGTHTVGRQGEVSILLPDRQVSRKHAVFTVSPTTVTVEDFGSANGTAVNGELIQTVRELSQGDRVTFGELELVVELLYEGGSDSSGGIH